MKLMTYNIMVGGVEPEPSRLELTVLACLSINKRNSTILGMVAYTVSYISIGVVSVCSKMGWR